MGNFKEIAISLKHLNNYKQRNTKNKMCRPIENPYVDNSPVIVIGILCGLVAASSIFIAPLGKSYRDHRSQMLNNPQYRIEYSQKLKENRKKAHKQIRKFTDNCKWCYGR